MSVWENLLEKCVICNKKVLKNKLTLINNQLYCSECKEKIKKKCEKCNQEFPESELISYRKMLVCKTCKKELNEQKKKKDEKQNEEEKIQVTEYDDEHIKQIISEQMSIYKYQIISEILHHLPLSTNSDQNQGNILILINNILTEISTYDFETLISDIKRIYDLEKYEQKNEHGYNFFYYMENIQKESEITSNKEKYEMARLINRVKRGDSEMYRTVIKLFKSMIIELIKKIK